MHTVCKEQQSPHSPHSPENVSANHVMAGFQVWGLIRVYFYHTPVGSQFPSRELVCGGGCDQLVSVRCRSEVCRVREAGQCERQESERWPDQKELKIDSPKSDSQSLFCGLQTLLVPLPVELSSTSGLVHRLCKYCGKNLRGHTVRSRV